MDLLVNLKARLLRPAPSAYEKAWASTTSPDMQQYIKTDPVIKGVATGAAVAAVVNTTIEAAPLVVNGVQQLNNGAQVTTLLMNNTTTGQVVTGLAFGIAGTKTNLPRYNLPTQTQTNFKNLINVIDYFSSKRKPNNQ